MRRVSISLVLLFTVLLLAACAAATGSARGRAGTPGGSVSSSGATTGPVPSGAPSGGSGGSGGGTEADAQCPKGVRSGDVTVTELDNGTAVCLARGSKLDVYLRAKLDQRWTQPTPDRAILQPYANGRAALQVGVTAGFFTAASSGQAHVTAQLAPCRGPKPGPACEAIELFTLTVTVR
jgi:hypothetical protein